MLSEFFCCRRPGKDRAIAWAGLVVILAHAVFSAYIRYAINGWYTTFYDLLQQSGSSLLKNGTATATAGAASAGGADAILAESQQRVWDQLLVFFRIVLPSVLVSPAARWARSHWALRWRMCLMRSYMDAWDPNLPPIEGASQRLHEDTQRFSKGIDTYLAVLLNSACTLVAFTPILFDLGHRVAAPHAALRAFGSGWMFVSALASAVCGLGVAMLCGRRLVVLEVANQQVEAELRRDAVTLETHPDSICGRSLMVLEVASDGVGARTRSLEPTYAEVGLPTKPDPQGGGGPPARRHLLSPAPHFLHLWRALDDNYGALFSNFFRLNLWLDCFDQVMILAPYVLVAPLLFDGDPARRITLGTLVQTSNSFSKVFTSLSVISENWGGINEWRSALVRLQQFEAALFRASSNGPMLASSESSEAEMSPICGGAQ